MGLDKSILEQYVYLVEEQKELQKQIKATERQIAELCKETVADSVTLGKHGKKPLGRRIIRGSPSPLISRRRAALRKQKALLEEKETETIEMAVEVRKYINEIDDSRIRRIFQYRYLDKLTWRQVAMRMGKHHTEESCRNAAERYLGKRK